MDFRYFLGGFSGNRDSPSALSFAILRSIICLTVSATCSGVLFISIPHVLHLNMIDPRFVKSTRDACAGEVLNSC